MRLQDLKLRRNQSVENDTFPVPSDCRSGMLLLHIARENIVIIWRDRNNLVGTRPHLRVLKPCEALISRAQVRGNSRCLALLCHFGSDRVNLLAVFVHCG